jgi:hypothetical protein
MAQQLVCQVNSLKLTTIRLVYRTCVRSVTYSTLKRNNHFIPINREEIHKKKTLYSLQSKYTKIFKHVPKY